MRTGNAAAQAGYTYFGLLLAITVASLTLSAGASLLGNEVRRDKERDLMFAGDAIRRAIEHYHLKNQGSPEPFPKRLESLLRDPHQATVQRHLRKIYRDPMHEPDLIGMQAMGGTWVLIHDVNGQIVGVHSNSPREPLRKEGFPADYVAFRQARSYADWKFVAVGGVPAAQEGTQRTPIEAAARLARR